MFIPYWMFWCVVVCSTLSVGLHAKTIAYLNDEKNKRKGVTVNSITTAIFHFISSMFLTLGSIYLLYSKY